MKDTYRFLAKIYDPLTRIVFFGRLKKAKNTYLNRIQPHHKVLIVGGGTGDELVNLLERNPDQKIDYLETSAAMTTIALDRSGNFNGLNVRFLSEKAGIDGKYDVIITSFFLDLFRDEELIKEAKSLYEELRVSGSWIFTDFQLNHNNKFWQKPLVWLMYMFFRCTTGLKTQKLPNFNRLFEELNLDRNSTLSYYGGLIVSSIYEKKSDILRT